MEILDLENSRENLGECKKDGKKRGRKSKKQNEKEIVNEFYYEIEKDKQIYNQRKLYESMNYLSKSEKQQFESKFTKPKIKNEK
jgi:hypothetical protein